MTRRPKRHRAYVSVRTSHDVPDPTSPTGRRFVIDEWQLRCADCSLHATCVDTNEEFHELARLAEQHRCQPIEVPA